MSIRTGSRRLFNVTVLVQLHFKPSRATGPPCHRSAGLSCSTPETVEAGLNLGRQLLSGHLGLAALVVVVGSKCLTLGLAAVKALGVILRFAAIFD